MDKRTAIGTGIASVLVVSTGAVALALNVGIVGSATAGESPAEQSVGEPVAVAGQVSKDASSDLDGSGTIIEYIDVYDTVTLSEPGAGSAAGATNTAPPAAAPAPTEVRDFEVPGVATVRVVVGGGDVQVSGVTTLDPWTYSVRPTAGSKVKVDFLQPATGQQAEFEVELVDGTLGEPMVRVPSPPAAVTQAPSTSDDEDHGEDHDEDHEEDHEDDEDEDDDDREDDEDEDHDEDDD